MKIKFIALFLLVAAACSDATTSQEPMRDIAATRALQQSTTSFQTAYNAWRAQKGLTSMRQSPELNRAAQRHAADMERRGYFGHSSVGGPNGADLRGRANAAGCDIRSGAENIAQGQKSEFEVFVAWRDSRGHRVNMENRKYTEYGLGRAGDTWVMNLSSGC
jgi:uncharacterized protein YkwD